MRVSREGVGWLKGENTDTSKHFFKKSLKFKEI